MIFPKKNKSEFPKIEKLLPRPSSQQFLDVLLWECFWMNKPSAGDNLLRVAQNRWLVAQNKWAKISLNRVMHTRYVTVRKNQIAIDFQARRCLFLALTKGCLLIFLQQTQLCLSCEWWRSQIFSEAKARLWKDWLLAEECLKENSHHIIFFILESIYCTITIK